MNKTRDQLIALSLTALTCVVLIIFLGAEIVLLNHWIAEPISLSIRWADVLVGLTIYLKTSIDFAMFIGRLMDKNPGLRGRIGIEVGTALGNAAGTMGILLAWSFFKEIHWLLAIMIVIAALVLLRLAQDGLEHIDMFSPRYPGGFKRWVRGFDAALKRVNGYTSPLLSRIVPSQTMNVKAERTLLALLAVSFTVPFVLGLDDFAGYVPLFNVVNVFGFGMGVFVGHMLLNILLYLSPRRTISAVKNPLISLAGSVAFVGLAGWGLFEAVELFLH